MSLDRQAIEKRDFPISRRGYETLAVDAHLAQLAREVETLQAERQNVSDPAPAAAAPSLANSASEQVRSIVQAAERSAAEIEQQATDEAARHRSDAARDAEATRASAESTAQDHVSTVQGETRSMLERIQAVESLLAHLKTTAQEIQSGLEALHGQVGTLGGGPESAAVVESPVAAISAPPVADAPPAAIAAASIA
ncbi:MAG: DivIVA domain-containing protein, partial [Patulibacter sp.]